METENAKEFSGEYAKLKKQIDELELQAEKWHNRGEKLAPLHYWVPPVRPLLWPLFKYFNRKEGEIKQKIGTIRDYQVCYEASLKMEAYMNSVKSTV